MKPARGDEGWLSRASGLPWQHTPCVHPAALPIAVTSRHDFTAAKAEADPRDQAPAARAVRILLHESEPGNPAAPHGRPPALGSRLAGRQGSAELRTFSMLCFLSKQP